MSCQCKQAIKALDDITGTMTDRDINDAVSGLELPNMDCSWPDNLLVLAACFDLAAQYARAKCNAMQARGAGSIQTALQWEQQCEAMYAAMPESIRW